MKPEPGAFEPARHRAPRNVGDRWAYAITRALRFFADLVFAQRYGHRAVVLETVAAVPGMVGATLTHLRCLRRSETDNGWIRRLMDEAENERMHLMTFIQIAQPSGAERALVPHSQMFRSSTLAASKPSSGVIRTVEPSNWPVTGCGTDHEPLPVNGGSEGSSSNFSAPGTNLTAVLRRPSAACCRWRGSHRQA